MRPGRLAAISTLPLFPMLLMAGVVEVQVSLPTSQKIDTTGLNRLLVAGFRSGDHPTINLDEELIDLMRSMFRKRTGFEVLDIDPLPLPEQPMDEVIRNTAYWKRLGKRYNADLIIGGSIDFTTSDQSGFAEHDVISQITGQRIRQTVWVEREAFLLDLGLYFFRGASGELVYEDHYSEQLMFPGKFQDPLSVLHGIVDDLEEPILGIVTSRRRVETRYLFTE